MQREIGGGSSTGSPVRGDTDFQGIILRTTDGGASWTRQFGGAFWPLTAAAFLDAQTGTVVGLWGTILHTTTGGE